MNPQLQTERLVLRQPRKEDLAEWMDFFLSERAVFVGGGPERDEGLAWRAFASVLGHWQLRGFGPFVMTLKRDGTPIGSAGPWFPQGWPERELSWSLWHGDWEGHGYIQEATIEMRRHVFQDLGWATAVSYVDPNNEKSASVAKRLGCVLDPRAATPGGDQLLVFRHAAV